MEYLRAQSPIYDHYKTTGHEVSLDNSSIVDRDDQSMTRTIREAMLMRVNDPFLNRNIGKYQLVNNLWPGDITACHININYIKE